MQVFFVILYKVFLFFYYTKQFIFVKSQSNHKSATICDDFSSIFLFDYTFLYSGLPAPVS